MSPPARNPLKHIFDSTVWADADLPGRQDETQRLSLVAAGVRFFHREAVTRQGGSHGRCVSYAGIQQVAASTPEVKQLRASDHAHDGAAFFSAQSDKFL